MPPQRSVCRGRGRPENAFSQRVTTGAGPRLLRALKIAPGSCQHPEQREGDGIGQMNEDFPHQVPRGQLKHSHAWPNPAE